MALIRWAKPLKKANPCSAVSMASSSSKEAPAQKAFSPAERRMITRVSFSLPTPCRSWGWQREGDAGDHPALDRKSTRLNSIHQIIPYSVFSFTKKNTIHQLQVR